LPANPRLTRSSLARFFVVSMVFLHGYFLWVARDRIWHGFPDFSIFYTAGRMIRSGMGGQLYSVRSQLQVQQTFISTGWLGPLPFNHPPFEALPFVPLTFLSYATAFVVWDLLSLGVLFAVVVLLRKHSRVLAGISVMDGWLALIAFFPVLDTLLQGQDSIVLLLIFALAYDALSTGEDARAGIWFGLSLFKFQFAVPLVLLLTLWGRRRTGAAFAATGAALVALSLSITGWKGLLDYPRFVAKIASTPNSGRTPTDIMANLHGLVEGWGGWPPPKLGLALVLVLSAAVLAWAASAGQRLVRGEDWPAAFSFAIVVCVLVSYQANPHDLTLLVIPIALLLDRFAPSSTNRHWNWRLCSPVLPLLVSPVWITVWLGWGHTNIFSLLLIWWAVALAAIRQATSKL